MLMRSYQSSKARCAAGIASSMQKSFGTREEHRMTLRLARQVCDELELLRICWNQELTPESTISQPFWRIPTAVFLGYLRANINRFTTGFEYVRTLSLSPRDYVSWEHSQMMIMFLQLLKFSYGSHQLSRESALWCDQKQSRRSGRNLCGLGFSVTLPQSGYCWFLPKIDWAHFTFRQDLPGQSLNLFSNVHMAEAYQVRWQAVRESKDDFVRLDTIASWLRQYQSSEPVCKLLTDGLIWLCVRHFRKDVLASIKKSIRAEYQEDAMKGNITLCKANLDLILEAEDGEEESTTPQYRLAAGNNLAYKNLTLFTDFLWDFDDKQTRKHWDNKSYRMLYQRASEAISAALGNDAASEFAKELKCCFHHTNWVIPYPNKKSFWQHTNKQRLRLWLSVWHTMMHDKVAPDQTVSYSSITRYTRSGRWFISFKKNDPVMKAIPEEPPQLSLDEMKCKIETIIRSQKKKSNGRKKMNK